jgi:hypothetical protein
MPPSKIGCVSPAATLHTTPAGLPVPLVQKAASIFYRTAATHQEILRQAAAKALRLDRPRLENQKFSFDFSADLNRGILAPILAPRFGQMLEALAENEPNQ